MEYCLRCKDLMWVLVLLQLLINHLQVVRGRGCREEEKKGLLEFKAFLKLNDEDADFLLRSWRDVDDDCCNWERVTCNLTTGRVEKLSLYDVRQQQQQIFDDDNVKFLLLNASIFLHFKELHHLNLSGNAFDGFFENEGIKSLSKLKKLEILDLGDNWFNKTTILEDLGGLTSLKALDVSFNNIEGHFPSQGFCRLNKLQELDLSYNFFQGTLPPCLNNFTSLRLLDLAGNQLSGNIPSPTLPNLTSLEYIDLSHNQFEGSFSFSSFANHSKLQSVILGSENNKFEVETERPVGWVPLFQLKALQLSNCKLMGEPPGFLRNQLRLIWVDLSHNNLTGSFPNWLLDNNTRLQSLVLRNNSLKGQLLLLRAHIHIQSLDVSHNNQLDGQLQENVGHMIPNLKFLNLSSCGFDGILPSSIAEMSSLRVLGLSANNFSGEVPKKLLATKLAILDLSDNNFHGEIFTEDFNLTQLLCLYLDYNQFTGTLSSVISRSSELYILDVSNNYLSGEIPSWLCNMTNLVELIMRSNNFTGKLPPEISQLQRLEFLNVFQNGLSGSLPSLSNMPSLKHLHLGGNKFTGSIPEYFLNSSAELLTLGIRDNMLTGSIPSSISGLSELRIIMGRRNLFSGFIPNHLCRLTQISLMDLSYNFFSGPVPKCFGDIQFGGVESTVFTQYNYFWYGGVYENIYAGYLLKYWEYPSFLVRGEKDEFEFVTKNRRGSYKGNILNYMSGLDLSCNNLTGEIPGELGMLSSIRALNLSHNQLKGSIPKSFSNLSQIESLDLSYNKLSGEIPPELVELNFLSVFSVAHNNLSGRVPDMKAQFGTFDESNYADNPFLCGPLLNRKCNTSSKDPPYSDSPPESSRERDTKWYDINHVVFFVSFVPSYVMVLLGLAIALYVNPNWRQRWFNFIEKCIFSCYYFVFDTHSN